MLKNTFTLTQFSKQFPDNESCLEEIKRLRFPKGTACVSCHAITTYYKISSRTAYACEFCRYQIYPLAQTIFEKTTTPLRLWFFCMYLMVCTRGAISARKIQNELDVTYKTAWRMRKRILELMKQNHADLLEKRQSIVSVSFFNALELKIVNKQEVS